MTDGKKKLSGYDRYINWKFFVIPLGLLLLLLFMPLPNSMLDVGVEYAFGPKYMQEFFSKELFAKKSSDLAQWEIQMVRMMVESVENSSFGQGAFMKRDEKWCKSAGIPSTKGHLEQVKEFVKQIPPDKFKKIMEEGFKLKTEKLTFDELKDNEKQKALQAGFKVKAAVGIVIFVVLCFATEAIPLPMVAFCVGIIAICTGIVDRHNIAGLYWSDATWFIMGSLMFAAAFVKTGVDKRIAMMMFGKLKNPDIKWISLIIILVISPLTMFMSDHALAAMFLPIGMLLYTASSSAAGEDDPELGKMIMMTIAMAANLAGSLAPSGAARNIIMMSYAEQMFGLSIGFGEWCLYAIPFLLFLIPICWIVINWRFKPKVRDLSSAMALVKEEINRSGREWTRPQILSICIFAATLFCWITEKDLIYSLTGVRFGIGVFAVMGAMAYMFAGITNWRDYQTKVDWGVVWLYAGAIIFGYVLVSTGGAFWIARTMVGLAAPLGLDHGLGLLLTGNVIVGLVTQVMADGPACAAVGPVTMAMAGIVHPGTSMIPFMAMGTAIASSFAYCLVIGTPPNAIVYSSGVVEAKDFLRVGVILWFTNMAGLLLMSATYWHWMGWKGLAFF
jgi:sodium-dependent dicarboxylate transporter 2/3/5